MPNYLSPTTCTACFVTNHADQIIKAAHFLGGAHAARRFDLLVQDLAEALAPSRRHERELDALGHFERFRDRFIGGEAAMSSAARSALNRWFQTADQAGPLRPKILERAKLLMATIEDEILALGGPLERYGIGDETLSRAGPMTVTR